MDAVSDVSRGSQIFSAVPARADHLPDPIDVDDLLGFAEAIKRRDLRRGLLNDTGDRSGFGKSKIFINHVDSYIGKYLVSVLSQKSEVNLVELTASEAAKSSTNEEKSKEKSSFNKETPKSPKREKSPKKAKPKGDKSPIKATSKKERSPSKSKASKKSGKSEKSESPRKLEIDFDELDEVAEEEKILFDTSKLTVPEYYELMELEPGEIRNKYLEEKLGKYLPKSSTDIKSVQLKSVKSVDKKMMSRGNLEIMGTLTKEGAQEVPEGVQEIIQVSEYDEDFVKTLSDCAAVLYVINEDFEQVHEANWVLNGLVNYLEDVKISGEPLVSPPPVFILVSTFMTWALTKPFDPNRPDLPFIEKDYRKRAPHPNYQHHFKLEEQLIQMKSNGCIDAVIVTCGIPYGHEESTFTYLFKMAFDCQDLPVLEPGSNYLPLMHVEHLGLIIKQILKIRTDIETPFVFAVDPVSYNTMREIVEAISYQFGNGCVRKMSKLFSFLRDEITQDIYDEVNANIVLGSCYPLYKEEDIKWKYGSGFVANIKEVVDEYISANRLSPLRIAFYYSHGEFKEVAQQLSDHYGVPLVTPRSVIPEYVNEVLDKMRKLVQENKEGRRLEEDDKINDELNDDKECKDESFVVAMNLIKHLDIKQTKDLHRLSEVQRRMILREILKRRRYTNRGYILDDVPRTSEGIKGLFYFDEDNGSKYVPPVENTPLPNYVIYLKSCDKTFESEGSEMSKESSVNASIPEELDSVENVEESSLAESYQEKDSINSFKFERKAIKMLPTKVVEFFLENNSQCKLIEKEIKGPYNANEVFKDLVKAINSPDENESYGSRLSSHQKINQSVHPEDKQSLTEEKSSSIELNKAEMKKEDFDLLKEEEERILAVRSVPYLKYLIKYIFPTLTNAILEVSDNRPEDPLDFIAAYLFTNNPEGRMFDPSEEIRRQELLEKNKGVVKVDSKACLV